MMVGKKKREGQTPTCRVREHNEHANQENKNYELVPANTQKILPSGHKTLE